MAATLKNVLVGATDFVLTSQLGRTSLGAAVGLALAGATTALAPAIPGFVATATALDLQAWHWLAFGVLLAHLPTVFVHFRGPATRDLRIASALGVIDSQIFSASERRQHYRALIASVYESVTR